MFVHYLFTVGAEGRQAWLLRLTHHFRVEAERHSWPLIGHIHSIQASDWSPRRKSARDFSFPWIFKTGCVMMGMVASNSDHNVQRSAESDFLILDYLLVSWFVTLDPRPEINYSSILKLLESCLL